MESEINFNRKPSSLTPEEQKRIDDEIDIAVQAGEYDKIDPVVEAEERLGENQPNVNPDGSPIDDEEDVNGNKIAV